MSSRKRSGKPKVSTHSALEDNQVLDVKQESGNSSSTPANKVRSKQLKVEIKTLNLTKESEMLIMNTLKQIHGKNFVLRDRSSYQDKGENLSRQYWIDRGHLVVQGGIDYSACKKSSVLLQERVNMFALTKLLSYGFHKSHCAEALELTGGDVGVALEVLLSQYLHLGLKFPCLKKKEGADEIEDDDEDTVSVEKREYVLNQQMEEKVAIEAIYGNSFMERIANRVWVLKLRLDYILDFYDDKIKSPVEKEDWDTNSNTVNICRFFLKGNCKFGPKCRFLHQTPALKSPQKKADKDPEEELFQLEFRFPEGSLYPLETACVYVSTRAPKVPPEACLLLSAHLTKEAQSCANSEQPCVYMVVQILLEQQDDVLSILRGGCEVFIDPSSSLFPSSDSETKLEGEKVRTCSLKCSDRGQQRQPRQQPTKEEMLREDAIIANKFKDKQSCSHYRKSLDGRRQLPAWKKQADILELIRRHQVVVISGETGCGKSTQVPQFVLDDWLVHRNPSRKEHVEIVCTQPRRLSAIGVAERVAEERAERVGNVVGYQIRLESKVSTSTRLLFCTTGILLRRLEGDPHLSCVSHIIVDEVHERTEESDFLLLVLRDLLTVRSDLKVILMSATLNADLFSKYFRNAPVIDIPGRTFPVKEFFLEDILEASKYTIEENTIFCREMKKQYLFTKDSLEVDLLVAELKTGSIIPNAATKDEYLTVEQLSYRYQGYDALTKKTLFLMDHEKINYELIEAAIMWIVEGTHDYPRTGSILVFLPGLAEISTLHEQLNDNPVVSPRHGKFVLVPLHSTLTSEEQALVFRKPKQGMRKIVLSTNIAETSVTIDDCVFVIDSGRMKEKRFDSNKNMESLDMVWVSRANAQQRKGRAGRVMPGVCIYLFTEHRYRYHLLAQPIPELHRVPLEQLLLRIKTLSAFADRDPHEVLGQTLEPPPNDSIDSALARLKDIGALDPENELTALGRHLAALPVDVRIGKLIIFGAIFYCVDSVLTMAACLSYKSPFVTPFASKETADAKKKEFATSNSDQLTVLKAYKMWLKCFQQSRSAAQVFAHENFLSWRTLTSLAEIKHQFLELLASIGFVPADIVPRRSSTDRVLAVTGSQLNANGDNHNLLRAILCAALYPNVVKVLTPEKSYTASVVGAIPKQHKSNELKFKTRDDGYVFLHPSSVNYSVTHFTSPYLVYQEKVKTSRVYIRDCSMVPVMPLVLFSGCGLQVELNQGEFVLALADGWIKFLVDRHQVAELLQSIRSELVKLLEEKIEDPALNLLTHERGNKIINTILHLVTKE